MSSPHVAVEDEEMEPEPTCWCCGRHYPEDRLIRLGTRPEAAVCIQCAKFLGRRAREQNDVVRGNRGLAARGRVVFKTGRDVVIRHGWQHGHISGPVLRWVDKFMP
jgi:hypothetical protein